MNPKQRELPILHDVVEMPNLGALAAQESGREQGVQDQGVQDLKHNASPLSAAEVNEESVAEINEDRVAQRVLAELLRHTDLIPEQRLREVLTPTLERFVDALIHDARLELTATLREVVTQELARRRP